MEDEKQVQIMLPKFCDRHQRELVVKTGYKPTDPWQALIIVAQTTMFQGMTVTPSVHKRIEGDITRIAELGCFACRLPHKWDEAIKAGKESLPKLKDLGTAWVAGGLNLGD